MLFITFLMAGGNYYGSSGDYYGCGRCIFLTLLPGTIFIASNVSKVPSQPIRDKEAWSGDIIDAKASSIYIRFSVLIGF